MGWTGKNSIGVSPSGVWALGQAALSLQTLSDLFAHLSDGDYEKLPLGTTAASSQGCCEICARLVTGSYYQVDFQVTQMVKNLPEV